MDYKDFMRGFYKYQQRPIHKEEPTEKGFYHVKHMHIIDVEYDDEYDFTGYFHNYLELMEFIHQNRAVGNTVIIVAPYAETCTEYPFKP